MVNTILFLYKFMFIQHPEYGVQCWFHLPPHVSHFPPPPDLKNDLDKIQRRATKMWSRFHARDD